jgi:hypothetical protein
MVPHKAIVPDCLSLVFRHDVQRLDISVVWQASSWTYPAAAALPLVAQARLVYSPRFIGVA